METRKRLLIAQVVSKVGIENSTASSAAYFWS